MPKKLLLVDTNIISHALTSNQSAAYAGLFKSLEKEYTFVVTGFTQFELMRSSDKAHRKLITDYLNQEMALATLSNILMVFASRVSFLYSKHKSTAGRNISIGDTINAAYVIAQDCFLLTIDNNDHPTPFFMEISRHRITYESKRHKETTDTAYILKPDMDHIKNCFEDHEV